MIKFRCVLRWFYVVLIVWFGIPPSIARDYDVACRIEDPTKVTRCKVLKKCTYRVYPVETIQTVEDPRQSSDCVGFTNIFSMYSGTAACAYFSKLIGNNQGCATLGSIVKQQLEKSDFHGVDLQCDPTVNGVNETSYNCCLRQLRKTIGGGYIVSVRIENPNLGCTLIDTLNEMVDVVNCPQTSVIQSLIANGLDSRKIVADLPLPSDVECPINDEPLRNISNTVRCLNLFGVILQLDRDDFGNLCGEGSFPLLNRLSILLEDKEPCDFDGFIPNPRDRSQFFSCFNGDFVLHQCPTGQLFDRMNSTCIPFVRMLCNETNCSFLGPITITNDTQFVPLPIPYPSDQVPRGKCRYSPEELKELKKLLNFSNKTFEEFIEGVKNLNASMDNIAGMLNNSHGPLEEGYNAALKQQGEMDGFGNKLGVLEQVIKSVVDLVDKVLGQGLGSLGG